MSSVLLRLCRLNCLQSKGSPPPCIVPELKRAWGGGEALLTAKKDLALNGRQLHRQDTSSHWDQAECTPGAAHLRLSLTLEHLVLTWWKLSVRLKLAENLLLPSPHPLSEVVVGTGLSQTMAGTCCLAQPWQKSHSQKLDITQMGYEGEFADLCAGARAQSCLQSFVLQVCWR